MSGGYVISFTAREEISRLYLYVGTLQIGLRIKLGIERTNSCNLL